MVTEKLVYSVNEVAGLLDMAPGSVYKACKNGQIPCLVIGKRGVIPKARFDRFLQGEVKVEQ